VGLAKDPDRIFLEDRDEPISLDDSSASSLLLKKIRDEVHRFAIRYHRKLRQGKHSTPHSTVSTDLGEKEDLHCLSVLVV